MTLDLAIGRWLACCLHPHAAWRAYGGRARAILLGTYFGAGYLATLAFLAAR